MEAIKLKTYLEKFSILCLDFDGVLVDSLELKGNCFAKLFNNCDKDGIQKKIFDHHKSFQGLSRYEKIKIYYSWVYNSLPSASRQKELSNIFAELVINELIKLKPSNFIKSLILQTHWDKKFIITRSNTDEIINYLENYELAKFFNHIYDSQSTKEESINKIKENNPDEKKIIFIGDSNDDKVAAEQTNVEFLYYKIGILNYDRKKNIANLFDSHYTN